MPTTTTRMSAPAATPRPGVLYTVPAAAEDDRGWRRLITGIDPSRQGAYALQGHALKPLSTYEIPDGALIVVCDKQWRDVRVTLYQAARGELEQVHAWQLKAPLGNAVLNYIGRRLDPDAHRHRPRPVGPEVNVRDDRCTVCLTGVAAGTGQILRPGTGPRYYVAHLDGQCAPANPIQRPNGESGRCPRCTGWIEKGEAIGEIIDPAAHRLAARYRPAHPPGACPEHPAPGPVNRLDGWCTDCGELVRVGAGFILTQPPGPAIVRHRDGECPPPREYDTWIIRLKRLEDPLTLGQAARVAIDLRPGGRLPVATVPPTAVGYRQLDEQYVQIIGVVIETARVDGARQARVRAATYPEAADVLAAELAAVPDARPEVAGFKARFSAERIGYGRPWLAEITGRDPDFAFRREFLRPDEDYSASNSKGTRGVYYHWTLGPNRYYETSYNIGTMGRPEWVRRYLRTTAEGDVVWVERADVETWLNAAPVWIAT